MARRNRERRDNSNREHRNVEIRTPNAVEVFQEQQQQEQQQQVTIPITTTSELDQEMPRRQQDSQGIYDADQQAKTTRIKKQVDEVGTAMRQNVDDAMERGERLEDIEQKTANLAEGSKQFAKNAKTVKSNLFWKNMKCAIIIAVIVLIILAGLGIYLYFQFKDKK